MESPLLEKIIFATISEEVLQASAGPTGSTGADSSYPSVVSSKLPIQEADCFQNQVLTHQEEQELRAEESLSLFKRNDWRMKGRMGSRRKGGREGGRKKCL